MNNDFLETINLMKKDNKIAFDNYQRIYAVTNENLNGLFTSIDLTNINNALTVTSSGDQTFNLITKDILNIDTFDSNILTNYYAFGLKKSVIFKYSYNEYLLFIKKIFDEKTSIEELYQILNDLIPFMEEEYREYFRKLIDYGYKNNINIMKKLCFNLIDLDNKSEKNNYLVNEENYNKLKSNLMKSNISFRHCSYYEICNLDKKYDLVYYSNIPDYFYIKYGFFWKYQSLNDELNNSLKIVNKDGLILMSYLYKCYYRDNIKDYLFYSSSVTKNELTDEEIILFDSIHKDKKYSNIKDGVLLKRN